MTWEIDRLSCPTDLSEEDILEAMKSIEGYLDITPSDFREFYIKAYKQARKRLLNNITADMIMQKPVHSVKPDETISQAAQIMADTNVSGLPVINDSEEIVGVVSEKDFLKELSKDGNQSFMSVIAHCLNNKGCVALPIKKLTVKDIMTANVVSVNKKDTLEDIINLLKKNEINRLPVKDDSNRLTGIITRSDIIKTLFNAVCSY
jgi:CBS domain-containing membrane protein